MPWRVVGVLISELRLSVRFFDGLEGTVDMQPLIFSQTAGVFATLRDPAVFCRVSVEHGAVTWPGEIDLAPDAMHRAIQRDGVWVP